MSAAPKRPLLIGPLKPPQSQPQKKSYAQKPASKNEVFITLGKQKPIPVVEFNSRAEPQPFLDPTIIPKRIQAEKQWKAEQEKLSKAEGSSQGH